MWLVPTKHACPLCLWYMSFLCTTPLSCLKSGFPSLRHNEMRDFTALEVCHDMCIEPDLQPQTLDSTSAIAADGARLVMAACGFWGGSTFFACGAVLNWWQGAHQNCCVQRLASMLAPKGFQTYSTTMAWLWCSLNFRLLR